MERGMIIGCDAGTDHGNTQECSGSLAHSNYTH
jgi:hypothetical protein